ncbi:glycoside hydrolase family 10 protein [Parathermosynechococcus lividus]
MVRRRYRLWLFLCLLCLGLCWRLLPLQAQGMAPIRGVWLTANDMPMLRDRPRLEAALNDLQRLNFNTLYPVVWNSGYVSFPSATATHLGIQPFVLQGVQGYDILRELTEQAHCRNLLVIPWFEFGFMVPETSELSIAHPDWLTQGVNGETTRLTAAGEVAWLNPLHPEVQSFLTNIVLEVLRQYPVDGIQFDDHLSLPTEFGYDAYTRRLYEQETKKPVPANPRDEAWMRWRADKLTAFVKSLRQRVKQEFPYAIFSVSPTTLPTAYQSFLQDWPQWVAQGIPDEVVVQVYRYNLPSFVQQLAQPELLQAQAKIPTAVGVLTGLRTNPVPIQLVDAKVEAAQRSGFGVSFFFYETLWERAPEPRDLRQNAFLFHFRHPMPRRTFGQACARG